MEGVRVFLESSTIHGLSYISTTSRLVKIFWILVVIGGFTGAGVLIYQSFQAWNESPVTTTIETLPITEIIKDNLGHKQWYWNKDKGQTRMFRPTEM